MLGRTWIWVLLVSVNQEIMVHLLAVDWAIQFHCAYMETRGKWKNHLVCFSLRDKFVLKQRKGHTRTCYSFLLQVLSDSNTVSVDFWSTQSAHWHGTRALNWLKTDSCFISSGALFFSPNPVSVLLFSAGNPDNLTGLQQRALCTVRKKPFRVWSGTQ